MKISWHRWLLILILCGSCIHQATPAIAADLPELQAVALSIPRGKFETRHSAFTLSYTITNTGTAASSDRYDNIYFSKDRTYDPTDILAISYWRGAMSPNTRVNKDIPMDLHNITATGSYYVLVFIDAERTSTESNEQNNVLASSHQITLIKPIPADLVPISFGSLPTSTLETRPDAFELTYTVKNQGPGAAQRVSPGGFQTDLLYLSSDQTLHLTDLQIASFSITTSLSMQKSETYRFSVDLTHNDPVGSFYLILKVNAFSSIPETTETNNILVSATPITIVMAQKPDITPVTVSELPISAHPNGIPLKLSVTIANNGPGKGYKQNIAVHLSKDAIYDAPDFSGGDHIIGQRTDKYTLGVGINRSVNMEIDLRYIQAGNYYLIIRAYEFSELGEANESNSQNIIVGPFTLILSPQPDLLGKSITPTLFQATKNAQIAYTSHNQGEATSRGRHDGIYISSIASYDINAQHITDLEIPSIVAHGSVQVQGTLDLSDIDLAGQHYLLIDVDGGNGNPESNENNNWFSVPITLEIPLMEPVQACLPSSSSSYTNGARGSTFTITGDCFPANTPLGLTINGQTLTDTITLMQANSFVSDGSGRFVLDVQTANDAALGLYIVSFFDAENRAMLDGSTLYGLFASAPLRSAVPPGANSPASVHIVVPSSITPLSHHTLLPMIRN